MRGPASFQWETPPPEGAEIDPRSRRDHAEICVGVHVAGVKKAAPPLVRRRSIGWRQPPPVAFTAITPTPGGGAGGGFALADVGVPEPSMSVRRRWSISRLAYVPNGRGPDPPPASSAVPEASVGRGGGGLRAIEFEARAGELVLVCGRVGSGKTSLCSALLGQLRPEFANGGRPKTPTVALCGRAAYVPQNPFVMNASVRENILFASEMDAMYYDTCVHAAALSADIASFPAADSTEVGERATITNALGAFHALITVSSAI